jgi:hypothetical protein
MELSDILAFRFRCKRENCGTELSVPLQTNFGRHQVADSCPNCGSSWLVIDTGIAGSGSSIAPLLEKIAKSLEDISKWPGHFEMTLEVKPEPEETK